MARLGAGYPDVSAFTDGKGSREGREESKIAKN